MSGANSYVLGLLIFVSRSRSHFHLHRYSDYRFNRRVEIDLHRRSQADDQTVPDLPVRTLERGLFAPFPYPWPALVRRHDQSCDCRRDRATGIHLAAELRQTAAAVRVSARSIDKLTLLFPDAAQGQSQGGRPPHHGG